MSRLLVIGGGITGLSAAWRARSLSEATEITVVEKEPSLGGKIQTEARDGFLLEAGADGFLSRKPEGISLCGELGVSGLLRRQVARKSRSFVMRSHKLHPMPEGFSGLVPTNLQALKETQLLSEEGKRRAMQEPSIPARADPGDESIAQFMTRRFGREAFEVLIEPLLAGIYAGDSGFLSLNATFPNLKELEMRHGSVLGGMRAPVHSGFPPFVSFSQGMAEMVRQIWCRLNAVRLAPATEARVIVRRGRAWLIELADGGAVEADAVIVAVPSGGAARLLEGVDHELADALGAIPSASTAVIHLGFRQRDVGHDLDGYGYVIPRIEASDLLACTWSSSKWENRAPQGMVLLRLYSRRLASDGELEDLARGELKGTMGIVASPVLARVFRWPHAMPQYTLEHPARLEAIQKRVAGLEGIFLAGASYRGVGIPDCIESGFRAARAAMEYLE